LLPLIIAIVALYVIGGIFLSIAAIVAALSGVALFPILLPWLPTKDFCTKGFILGILVALPFATAAFWDHQASIFWLRLAQALILMLCMPPVTAYLALNFTGSSPSSRTGVKREIIRYVPIMAGSFVLGAILYIAITIMQYIG